MNPIDPADARKPVTRVLWLQSITVAWMLLECGIALWSAARARSPVLLAFGADSAIELISATVVVLQYAPPRWRVGERTASRVCGGLLFVLAGVVVVIAVLTMLLGVTPQRSIAGMAIAGAALVIMPVLAAMKRKEARRRNDAALAADAVQSATCAWLALITLAGLAANAWTHRGWMDSVAALAIVPFLLKEGREAWRGRMCTC
jgi:hypothetical protein